MYQMHNELIVISAVNIVEGGALAILQDCLYNFADYGHVKKYKIVALVNSCERLPKLEDIIYFEFPKAKSHYYLRFYYEYFAFNRLSKQLKPKLWLSLHDMSPIVHAEIQAVYMHNPSPFFKPTLIDWKFAPINALWAYIYKYIYRINIHSNNYLIVQQNWLRKEFSKMFSFPPERIIVARPENLINHQFLISRRDGEGLIFQFVYPAYPRVFKNFVVICEAARMLESEGVKNVIIKLTIDGTENSYSRFIFDRYGDCKLIDFVGLLDKGKMKELYDNADCLLFPSKLETWGLPLSEYKPYNRPMIVADLPYAHESVAGATKVRFFNPDNAAELATCMKSVVSGDLTSFCAVPYNDTDFPATNSWKELFELLLKIK